MKTCKPSTDDYERCAEYYKCPLGAGGDLCRIEHSPNKEAREQLHSKKKDTRQIENPMEVYHKNLFMISLDGMKVQFE